MTADYKIFDDTVFISIIPPSTELHGQRLCVGIRKTDLQRVRINIKDYHPWARVKLNKLIPCYKILYIGYDCGSFVGRNFEFFTKDRRKLLLRHIEEVMTTISQ
jgi:hypothetical protein